MPQGLGSTWIEELSTKCLYAQTTYTVNDILLNCYAWVNQQLNIYTVISIAAITLFNTVQI
jgi:hypothetical protein